jgi:nucleoside-diphosphate-sugar epimerase
LISVWNLADAVVQAVGYRGARFHILHVADSQAVSTADLITYVARGLGRKARLLRVPPALIWLALRAAGRGSFATRLLDSLELDTSSSCAELNWQPSLPVEEGLCRAAREMLL